MASTLPKTLNVSRFFNRKDFSNTVEIIVNDTKFVCSGAVIAQQSPVFEKLLLSNTNFIMLEDFKTLGIEVMVEECLVLLYGGTILITLNNIQTLTRFSLIYEVRFMYDMCLKWIRDSITTSNVLTIFQIGNLPEVRTRRDEILDCSQTFMKEHEDGVADELKKLLTEGQDISLDFIKAFLELSNCSCLMEFIVDFSSLSRENTLSILQNAGLIHFEELFINNKDIFNSLMSAFEDNIDDVNSLRQVLSIQMRALSI